LCLVGALQEGVHIQKSAAITACFALCQAQG
jgi:hypothetical protein